MGGFHIHVAVPHIQGAGWVGMQGLQQGVRALGGGLGGHAGHLAAHDRKILRAEIILDDLFCQRIRLVGKHRQLHAVRFQLCQHFWDAGVRCGSVPQVLAIIPLKICQGRFQHRRGALVCRG